MKMNVHLVCIIVLLLGLEDVHSNLLEDTDIFPEARERCAKPDESCSKGSYGHGPRHCCPPKGCSCNPFTGNCDCSWDTISSMASKAWDWVTG